MAKNAIDISIKGKWTSAPALFVDGKTLVAKGRWIKVASIHDEAWLETELDNPDEFVERLKLQQSNNFFADIFTFAQKVPATAPKYHFPMELDSVAVARFGTFQEWWDKLPQETRKNVRRSQKRGLVISITALDDGLVKGISLINNESPVRQGRPNAHYGKPLEQVRKDHSAFLDHSDFICAYLGDELVGFLKLVYRGDVASILNLAAKAIHYDKRPTNALVAKAVELCEAKGISYLTYGMYNYGNKHESPLREFKDRNGFEEAPTPRFFVPLTPWGEFCMKAGCHRGLLGILPHSIITFGVNVRARWYNGG
jgi:hypothetical protein